MGLFGFGKKKEEEGKTPACSCNGACKTYEADSVENVCCEGAQNGICCIRILGSGCKNCHILFENTQAALKNMGLSIEPEYITDMEKIMSYGVMSMPAHTRRGDLWADWRKRLREKCNLSVYYWIIKRKWKNHGG